MGRQRNNLQMKEKEAFPEKELSETEASKLSDRLQSDGGHKDAQGT